MALTSAELKERIAEILKDADLETTSAKKVRTQLEEALDTDLTSRKEEIGKLIQEVMDENADEDEDEEEDKEDEEGIDFIKQFISVFVFYKNCSIYFFYLNFRPDGIFTIF